MKTEARWPISKKLATIDRTIAENESRHDVLRQLNEEGEGLAQGSQALLKNKEFEFAGALAAQLNVSHELVPAIEAALGRNLHALVLRDAGRAAEVISHLNRHQLGQAALVLEGIAHRDRPTKDLPPTAIDWAANKVQAAEPVAPLVRCLLDRVALFQNLEDALIAIRRSGNRSYNAGWRIHLACGVLFGGSGKFGQTPCWSARRGSKRL